MITKGTCKMKKIEIIRELNKYPVFSLKTLSEIVKKNKNYAKLIAYRLKKENLLFEIERGKYTVHKNPLIIASNIIWPSYISCWSAIRYHNMTEQLPQTIFVVTTRKRKNRIIKLDNNKIIFIKISPKYFFGYAKESYDNFDIFIAEKEKALIDSSLLKKVSFSEICEIIKNSKDAINFNLLEDYLIKIGNKALSKRFGFLLDKIGVDAKKLKRLIDCKYVPLECSMKPKGKKDKKWRIIENVAI